MSRIIFVAVSVCTLFPACAIQPPKPEPVPKELVPAGFSAADCRIVKPAQTDVDDGPGGGKYSHGEHGPHVECSHHSQGVTVVKSTPTCKTKAGVDMPLSDCCLNDDGTTIPNCTIKSLPPGE